MAGPIPDAALAQHTVLLGKTRSGKSSTMRTLIEPMLDAGRRVCIIDPKGDWWGIKSSADGKKPGFPVVIFGGEHGDVPINEHSGAAVAELIATGNRPALIDLGGWMVGARTRFFIEFAQGLFRLNRGPMWLAIDEAHNFAPQGKVLDPDAGKALHWANRLAAEGAGKGIVLLSASQRPQKVHKDYLTSHETLIAKRVIHPLDRKAVREWMDGAGDPKMAAAIEAELASINRAEGWVWSPEIGFGPVKVTFPMFQTFDSFAAPTGEKVASLKGWASVDLDDVRAKLAAAVKEAKANDPRALKTEIVRLTKELAAKPKPVPVQVATVDPKAVEAADAAGYERGWNAGVEATRQAFIPKGRALSAALDDFLTTAVPFKKVAAKPVPHTNGVAPPPKVRAPMPARAAAAPVEGLTGPQMKVIEALAFWRSLGFTTPTRPQVGAAAGYSPSSGGFNNLLGGLRTMGMIDYPQPGVIALTEAGDVVAPEPAAQPVRDRLSAVLSGPQAKIVDALADGSVASRDELGERTGYSASSGGFNNLLGSLRTLGIIGYPGKGQVAVEPWVFG